MAAQEIVTEWKNRVGYRDIDAERETEQERIEREKFEDFMRLAPIPVSLSNRSTDAFREEIAGEAFVRHPTLSFYSAK